MHTTVNDPERIVNVKSEANISTFYCIYIGCCISVMGLIT